jgi:dual-specificity kinase
MSTPSIASATLSTHHMPYGYSHQNPYQVNPASYPANNSVPTPRLTNSYHTFPSGHQSTSYQRPQVSPSRTKQPSQATPMTTSQSTPGMTNRLQKKPDWNEYYKNGIPKEVIVIDDDTPPPPPAPPSRMPSQRGGRGGRAVQSTAGKKRKADDGYDARYNDSPAFSTHPAKFDEHSSRPSVSTDRTTSLHTTAPTSLGSYGSSGASNSYEDVNVGSKRKRAPPKETRSTTKRKQQEATSDAFADYVPPPKPPIKAAEVHVPVVSAVSAGTYLFFIRLCADNLQYGSKHQKLDDDDGHYVVTPGTDFTDRCMPHLHSSCRHITDKQADTIEKLLGQGTFGKVVEAWDKKKQTKCAVKIIRSVQKYRDASRIELRVLSTLSLNDKSNRNKCIHLRDSFDYRNHICIVTDLLGQSVFDFLKGNSFVPFPSTQIQSFARQLFTSVACGYSSMLTLLRC